MGCIRIYTFLNAKLQLIIELLTSDSFPLIMKSIVDFLQVGSNHLFVKFKNFSRTFKNQKLQSNYKAFESYFWSLKSS